MLPAAIFDYYYCSSLYFPLTLGMEIQLFLYWHLQRKTTISAWTQARTPLLIMFIYIDIDIDIDIALWYYKALPFMSILSTLLG